MIDVFLDRINKSSIDTTSNRARSENKEQNDQYFTPISIATFMSSRFNAVKKNEINILDPGCGTGNLAVALLASICTWKSKPKVVNVELFEIDVTLSDSLINNLKEVQKLCDFYDIEVNFSIKHEDFISYALEYMMNVKQNKLFDYIVMNPPYRKLNSESIHKKILLRNGIDVPNYYAGFMAVAYRLLKSKGELVTIVPRSFCSGTYFKSFREDLVNNVKIERIHIFKSRKDLFYDDILQETIILSLKKIAQKLNDTIEITESIKDDFTEIKRTHKRFDNVIFPLDPEKLIRIIHTTDKKVVDQMHSLPCRLEDLGINVSTGPVVDFREKPGILLFNQQLWAFPMIYQENFCNGKIEWPIEGQKPGFILEDESNYKRFRKSGIYVLVKRMTSKEEKKRIVAAMFDNSINPDQKVAFDNKLNYFHIENAGFDNLNLAKGLCLYLNSSLVDFYFRTFSGSTQVNVADLKSLRYPSFKTLEKLGEFYGDYLPTQEIIDQIMNEELK
ncbi:Eco57I restriction-modification methylase domain-containing protein [Bacillus sp. NPDC077411]|uniref:Eco57I restriction-modification methylase domain-containing protein n=1 Tax=Bacillus sp. NPDC077411 TaxID=3363947 RepID=UPI0037C517B6